MYVYLNQEELVYKMKFSYINILSGIKFNVLAKRSTNKHKIQQANVIFDIVLVNNFFENKI